MKNCEQTNLHSALTQTPATMYRCSRAQAVVVHGMAVLLVLQNVAICARAKSFRLEAAELFAQIIIRNSL